MQVDNIIHAMTHAANNGQYLKLTPEHLQLLIAHLNDITESKNELVKENQRLSRIERHATDDVLETNGASP